MNEYCCRSCGYVYDPEHKINADVPFSNLAESWVCPACNAQKKHFDKLGPHYSASKEEFRDKLRSGSGS